MNPQQIRLVQSSFRRFSADPDAFATAFYRRLFELAPRLRTLFKPDMKEQRLALMQMLAAAVRGLDDLSTLMPVAHRMGERHVGYGVQEADYALVGQALLDTLRSRLGAVFTPDVERAWAALYGALSAAMQAGAATVGAEVAGA